MEFRNLAIKVHSLNVHAALGTLPERSSLRHAPLTCLRTSLSLRRTNPDARANEYRRRWWSNMTLRIPSSPQKP